MSRTESPSTAGSHDFTFALRIDKRAGVAICIVFIIASAYIAFDLNQRSAVPSSVPKVADQATAPSPVAPVAMADNHEGLKHAGPERGWQPAVVVTEPERPANFGYEEPDPQQVQQIYASQTRELKVRNETTIRPTVNVERPTAPVRAPAPPPTSTTDPAAFNGAGATFPNPVYVKWFSEYHKVHSEVTINYQAIGSGGGIRQMQAATVDFGASDVPASDEQLAAMPTRVLHVPTVMGAVVLIYNLPEATRPLKFTPDIIAGIFLGTIGKWNDPAIADANQGVQMPETAITAVHRSDGSAPTYIITDYLSKISPEWNNGVGRGASVNWRMGLGGKGNEGVAGTVKRTPGAIGYVELTWAVREKVPMGIVQNASGQFIVPSLESVQAAATGTLPEDLRVSITNPPGKEAYPISSFTWLLVPVEWKDNEKKRAFSQFLNWMIDSGEPMVMALDYAPLPRSVAVRVKQEILRMR